MASSFLKRRPARSLLLAAVTLLGAVPFARAQTGLPAGNSELPINLEAASSDFDYKNNTLLFKRVKITQGGLEVTAQQASATGLEFNNSEWRLQGDVKITVPGGKLQSSEARVMFRNNAIASASIKGTPAQFEQQLKEKNQVARGRAAAIDYDVKAATVRLTGDAWLTDGNNEIRGNTLVYDIGRERVQANPSEKDPGGVKITINPPPEDSRGKARQWQRPMTMSRLRAEALGKSYRSRQVVKDLSLEVTSGEVVGLLGPNGAGKTTAFYMIVGLVPCDEGRIHLDDQELTRLPMYRRAQLGVGYLPQEASVFRKLSVEDNILAILETRADLDDDDGAPRGAGIAARGVAHRPHPVEQRHEPVGRRAPARRDRARAGRGAPLHPARRTVRGRGSDFGDRHPAHHPPPQFAQHRRTDHRPQRA